MELKLTGPCSSLTDGTVAAMGSAFGAGLAHIRVTLGHDDEDNPESGSVEPSFWDALATGRHLPHLNSLKVADDMRGDHA